MKVILTAHVGLKDGFDPERDSVNIAPQLSKHPQFTRCPGTVFP